MAVMTVDIQLVGAVGNMVDNMCRPYLVEKCGTHCGLFCKFIYSIDESLGTGCHYIGVGRETMIEITLMFDSHMHLADIVATLVESYG